MTLHELQSHLDRLGIVLSVRGDWLHWKVPAGVVTSELRAALTIHKPVLLPLPVGRLGDQDPAGPAAIALDSGPRAVPLLSPGCE
jgi:hypothetical protein